MNGRENHRGLYFRPHKFCIQFSRRNLSALTRGKTSLLNVYFFPNNELIKVSLGSEYRSANKNPASNFRTLTKLSSFHLISVAYLNLGTSLIALGRCHEAASVLRDGTKLDGTGLRDRSAHENARISSLLQLGGLYADQGKLQRALAVYREALHTLPHNYPPQVRFSF